MIQKKKEEKQLLWKQRGHLKPKITDFDVHNYNLGSNNIFLRFYDNTMNQLYNNRLIQAMKFGQKLVVDCGYDNNMTKRENTNCAKQLMLLFAENRSNDGEFVRLISQLDNHYLKCNINFKLYHLILEPFDLHYCNAIPNSVVMQVLKKFIVPMYEKHFPLNLHKQSYLEIVPKEQLVYLTPHCREPLTKFDHDAVYIIGAIVDKVDAFKKDFQVYLIFILQVNNEPLSLAKAKKEGLRMAKLPLDNYLDWGSGSGKSLTINQVASILLDIKSTVDWKYALRHVPQRKLIINDNKIKKQPKFQNLFKMQKIVVRNQNVKISI